MCITLKPAEALHFIIFVRWVARCTNLVYIEEYALFIVFQWVNTILCLQFNMILTAGKNWELLYGKLKNWKGLSGTILN